VGVSGGVEILIHGIKLTLEQAAITGGSKVVITIDVKNAHNAYNRLHANEAIEELATRNPDLSFLPAFHFATNGTCSDLHVRGEKGDLVYLTESRNGGFQGDAMTGGFFCATLNGPLKKLTANYAARDVEVHAIQDDITIVGDDIVDALAAMDDLLTDLAPLGMLPNLLKFQLYGTSDEAVEGAPDWLQRTSVDLPDGDRAYGVIICGAAVGEAAFEQAYIDKLTSQLCGKVVDGVRVPGSMESLASQLTVLDSQSASCVAFYSLQTRVDFYKAVHNPTFTANLDVEYNSAMERIYSKIYGVNLLDRSGHTPNLKGPSLVADRFLSKTAYGGGGYRHVGLRICFANSLVRCLPQLLVYFPKLTQLIGATSFQPQNKATRLEVFLNHAPTSSNAKEVANELNRVQKQYFDATALLPNQPPPCFLDEPIASWGESPKLQKRCFDIIRNMEFKVQEQRFRALEINDSRRIAFFANGQCKVAHALFQGHPDPNIKFSHLEYTSAVECYFGVPQSYVAPLLGQTIASSKAKSTRLRVDQFGYNIKKATCVKGGTTYALHNAIQAKVMGDFKYAGIRVTSGNGTFSVAATANGDLSEDQGKTLQKIVPDMVVYGQGQSPSWDGTGPALFAGITSLVDFKTLSPGHAYTSVTPTGPGAFRKVVNMRQTKVNSEYHHAAKRLDGTSRTTNVGIFESHMNSFGHDGEVLGFCFGAFGEASRAVYAAADFIATKRAHDYCTTHVLHIVDAKNMFRQALQRKWGLFAQRGWASLLFQRSQLLCTSNYTGGAADAGSHMHMEVNYLHPDFGGGKGGGAAFRGSLKDPLGLLVVLVALYYTDCLLVN